MTAEFTIQWYPGHMARAKRTLGEQLRGVDFVIEVADARAPFSTRNPDIEGLIEGRPRLLLLAKDDLVPPDAIRQWLQTLSKSGVDAVSATLLHASGLKKVRERIQAWVRQRNRGGVKPLQLPGVRLPSVGITRVRGVVVGMPNTGKSTLIRSLGGRGVQTGAKPGVTRRSSWVKVSEHIELLDTPGLMWPRAETGHVALKLAWLGCVADVAYDPEKAAWGLLRWAQSRGLDSLRLRYGLTPDDFDSPHEALVSIAQRRGFFNASGEPNTRQAAVTVMHEFRRGNLGKVCLDDPH